MKHYRFKIEKLVRDQTLVRMIERGAQTETRTLSSEEFIQCLKNKIVEEAAEVATATSHQELVNEIADVYEVIDALCAAQGITKEQLLATQAGIRAERGGFDNRVYASTITAPADSPVTHYVLLYPDKYPLIETIESDI